MSKKLIDKDNVFKFKLSDEQLWALNRVIIYETMVGVSLNINSLRYELDEAKDNKERDEINNKINFYRNLQRNPPILASHDIYFDDNEKMSDSMLNTRHYLGEWYSDFSKDDEVKEVIGEMLRQIEKELENKNLTYIDAYKGWDTAFYENGIAFQSFFGAYVPC